MLSRLMTRREQSVLTVFALALVIGAVSLYGYYSREHQTDPPQPDPPGIRPVESANIAPVEPDVVKVLPPVEPVIPGEHVEIAVAIQGAVSQPGLYRFDGNERVQDLIDEAGGAHDNADLSSINRAARLIDGTTLTIPEGPVVDKDGNSLRLQRRNEPVWNPPAYTIYGQTIPEASAAPANTPQPAALLGNTNTASTLLDLNRATAEELQQLPGIGPVYAAAIIDYRNAAPFRSVEELTEVSGIGPKRLETLRPLVTVQ